MGVDRGYGSGKPRSAANSRARQRAEVAGKRNVGQKKVGNSRAATFEAQRAKLAASPIGQLADTLLGFALPVGKVKAAAAVFRAKSTPGFASWAMGQLESRAAAKAFGKENAKRIASGVSPANAYSYASGPLARVASSGLYPKRVPTRPTTPAERIFDNPRWARPARPQVKPLPIPKGRGTPPDASKMLPPRKPKLSTKALRDYRSTGRPPSKPGSMEGWQGITNVRRGTR